MTSLAQLRAAGVLLCLRSNEQRIIAGLELFTVLRFSVEPVDMLAVRGLPAVLNCSVVSDNLVRVEWKKDGTFLNLAADERRRLLPDGSLFISTVEHSVHNKPDEGVYQCVASIDNLGTIISRSARVTVPGLPHFTSQPESVSVHAGGTEVLICEVSDDLAPFTHWQRNGQTVETDMRLVKLPRVALVISNASQADAGAYQCVIEGLGPSKRSQDAQLELLPDSAVVERMEVLIGPSAVSKPLGDTVLLPCVVKGFPLPVIRWMRNGKVVDESDERFAVIGGGNLQIVNLTEEDAGTYSCQADNGNETIETEAELNVQVPPRFLKKPSNMYAHEAMDVIFECDVMGSPAPTVKWVKNGDAVIPSDYFKIVNQHDLQVLGLVKSDEGFYQCVAENEVGNTQASAQLIILDLDVALPTSPVPSLTSATTDHIDSRERRGSVPSPPRDLVASLVSTRFIKLTWRLPAELHGDNLTYSVFYSLDGSSRERVENTTAPGELQVTIENLIPDTKYTFRVVASNRNGLGESSAPLTVATQPEVQVPGPAPNLQVVSITPTTVTLSWERPLTGNGEIQTYKLYYIEKGKDIEQDVDVVGLSYTMTGLKKFTEYSFRVVAYNKHGPGVSTDDLSVHTFSDVPSTAPQNISLEVQNSRSIMVRWQPPPPGTHNGELTGYKLRYRKAGRKGDAAEIITNQLFQLIDGLEKGTEYSFRLSAITVNGSGPASEWISAETFENDLDESQVPGVPSSLHVRPLVNSIVVSWTPPENQDIVVRGYSIGYGIGSPHSQSIKMDHKQRYYSIENLDPSSHYVITLKAFNNMGEGIPVYESAITRPQSAPEPSPMLPPVGVQASVISHDAVKVSWADNSLSKNQKITDSRFYTVRWKTNIPANTKYKVANTTTLTYTVTNLKPSTLYEFSVMVTKGRRSSTWSMTAHGTTLETLPTSAPKDVTVVSKEGRPRTININWQPPSEANGKMTGYIIYYSTDANAEVHDWVVEPVMGNRLTHQIQELTLDTTYYFKIQARNSKGMGPLSDAVHFRTPKAEPSDKMSSDQVGFQGKPGGRSPAPDHGFGSSLDKPGITGSQENQILVIIIIVSVGVFTIITVVVGAVLCTCHSNSHQKKKRAASKSSSASHKYKSTSKDLKPPDLWIHHERVEMKSIDKSPEPNVCVLSLTLHLSLSFPDKPGITGSQENQILVIIIIVSVGVFTIITVVVGAVLCTCHSNSHQKKKRAASKSSSASHKYKSTSKDLKPPDLWIHHERVEMKSIDKSPEPNVVMTETPIPRSTHESASGETAHQRQNTYRGHEIEESVSTLAGRRGMRPKIMMPFDSPPPQPVISAHPIHSLDHLHHHHHHHYHPPPRGYLHHQISLRAPATPSFSGPYLDRPSSSESIRTPGSELPVASSTVDLQHTEVLIKEDEAHCYKPPTAGVHPTHPMKSFTVPTVTVSTHSTPTSALPCTVLMPPPVPGVKTACIGTLSRARAPMAVTVPNAPDQSETSKMLPPKESAYRTDELSEEMAHLEGLMKDLNAITTA
ncbi:neogenin isoform X3 [Silurus asotus]|uniref:Neogenin isoform X3 n=1 Tax=Silurus asotus TaxID=30991 RepID=A0AAD5AF04_SILAS|nr:neogenin isoform X3 [Silurus asotus]